VTKTIALVSAQTRPLLEHRLPDWVEPRWYASARDILELIPDAEIGWLDAWQFNIVSEALQTGRKLKWLNTVAAGVETFPLDKIRERGLVLTNGAGINSITIAEYVVLGMLTIAKGYRAVVRAQDRGEWLHDAPGKGELHGSNALVLGAGGIGGRVARILEPFGVEVTTMRRNPSPGQLGPDDWRGRLGQFDWVVVTVAATAETNGLVGAPEFAAMKPGAAILNFARGFVIDTEAMLGSLREGRLGAAFLDVTDPEPLPRDHPLWSFDNVHLSMHLSGRSQDKILERGAERFLYNLDRYRSGDPLLHTVDPSQGY